MQYDLLSYSTDGWAYFEARKEIFLVYPPFDNKYEKSSQEDVDRFQQEK